MLVQKKPGIALLLATAAALVACGGGGGGGSSSTTTTSSTSSTSSSTAASSASTSSNASATATLVGSLGATGWATYGTGTTGGNSATAAKTYTVSTRAQLIQALYGNSATINADGSIASGSLDSSAKIIYVSGEISLNTNKAGTELTADDYLTYANAASSTCASYGYTTTAALWAAYYAAYTPSVWGNSTAVSGTPESARVCAANIQKKVVRLSIPSHTSIIGLGSNAKIVHGQLLLDGGSSTSVVSNIVIRNISFEDAFDFFPQWDPTDSTTGRWNSAYDNISVNYATNVWIDHNTFSDGSRIDHDYPSVWTDSGWTGSDFKVQHHDGLLDITKAANYVTASYNHFHDHDKSMLIGSTETASTTAENPSVLKVTLHHNYFQNLKQRQPLVRYGVVHLFNNYFTGDMSSSANYPWSVAWSQAQGAKLYVENNVVQLSNGTPTGANVYKGSSGSKTAACVTTTSTSTEYCSAYAWHVGNILNENALDAGGAVTGVTTTNVTVSSTPWYAINATTGAPTAKPSDFYTYTPEATSNLATTIPASAGAGKL
ncbi:pectate lyase family protein [Uliginosibacterium aquaticum]|uniref:Pectate lyase n=1 Tax=Uliginosibacterium aquaticum TaxID=2731212 RepID=A0ABX2IJ67_9RHOO|nr:pectate lyase [Uliginosibacterium aquaticum]NSL54100.1 pectate lyase [Uliginosibacterium aquaticum]